MKKISIIGASGFVGKNLFDYFRKNEDEYITKGTCFTNHSYPEFVKLDITSKIRLGSYMIKESPDFVVLLSGRRAPDCEKEGYSFAVDMHVKPIIDLINIIDKHNLNSKLIYLSSDYVFDGRRGSYTEEDLPNPSNSYGATKYACEILLRNSPVNTKILRASAIMGKGGLFFEEFVGKLKSGEVVNPFTDLYFSPTPIGLVKDITSKLISSWDSIGQKVIHLSGGKRLSRYDFVNFLGELVGADKNKIIPATKEDVLKKTGELDSNQTILANDWSIIPSDIVREFLKEKSFEKYMEEEIKG